MDADSSYPVSVRWSSLAAPVLLPHRQAECENPTTNILALAVNAFSSVMHNIVPGLTATNKKTICPSQRVLYADEVMALARSPIQSEREMLKTWVSNSIVLVGGQIDGIYDYVVSPVHGSLPGVFFHAMALDNLIVYGDAYTQEVPYSKELNLLVWCIYILALVMLKRSKSDNPFIQFLQQKLWLMCFIYITLMLSLLFLIFHASPSSWISLITLGWIGVKVIEQLEAFYEGGK
ncbi:CHASE2 domain-containing protein [Psychromonas sp. KJ10-10]|uniref:CHASE2 domain-containing protein n=1 Tax=Psychromonas sp. KJ10-10 TaxID=3391823 RepID=UPI0039B3C4A3